MEVKVTKDAPNFDRALNGIPPIDKNEVNAKVLVSDGETIVIGGVFSNTQTKSVDKVPFWVSCLMWGDFSGVIVLRSKSQSYLFS